MTEDPKRLADEALELVAFLLRLWRATSSSYWRVMRRTGGGFSVRGPLGPDGTPVAFKSHHDADFVVNAHIYLPAIAHALLDALEEKERLRQGLELTRMSVAAIMARPGRVVNDIDRDAKLSALEHIGAALGSPEEATGVGSRRLQALERVAELTESFFGAVAQGAGSDAENERRAELVVEAVEALRQAEGRSPGEAPDVGEEQ